VSGPAIPKLTPLRGADDSRFYSATNAAGISLDLRYAVVPIFTWPRQPGAADYRFIGTGFFVAEGLVLTAEHVAAEIRHADEERAGFVIQYLPNNRVASRRIFQMSGNLNSDVALLRVVEEYPGQSNPAARLGAQTPAPGSLAYTLACPNTKIFDTADGKQTIAVNYEYYRGQIIEYFPSGRDRALLRWPCFHVNFHMHAGASGGPVFDDRGRVFAINCVSNEPQTNIAYATSIDCAISLPVGDIMIHEKRYADADLGNLIHEGMILFD
jgi:hypothetical protein